MSSLFGNTAAATSTAAANSTGDISKDVALTQPPDDSISELAFSPAAEYLAVSSWDKKVRIYEINDQGNSQGKTSFDHEAPVLSCCWSPVCLPRSPPPLPPANIFFPLGWYKGRWWRRRQSRPHARSRQRGIRGCSGRRARSTYPLYTLYGGTRQPTHAYYRLVGQDR
jgi:hypothetical protein